MSEGTEVGKVYCTKITDVGSAMIAACILNGTKLNITEAAAGDGGGAYCVPDRAQTALVNERWRGGIASASQSEAMPNTLDIKIVIPSVERGFTVREMGVFSSDGTLVAVCNTPDMEKAPESSGVGGELTMIMHILVTDASVVEVTIAPTLDTVNREEMEKALAGKQDKLSGKEGQVVGFDKDGSPAANDYTALQVSFDPGETGMESENVESAIKELFTSGSEGKALIASAITAKGVDTAADASFADLRANILAIPSNELSEDLFTITVESGLEDGGTVAGGGIVQHGMTITIAAEAAENYVFQGWEENGETVSTSPAYTFTVDGNRTLTAAFEAAPASRLPEGYTEAEYIESDGYQYLSANFYAGSVYKVEMTAEITSTNGTFWGVDQFYSNAHHQFTCRKDGVKGITLVVNSSAYFISGNFTGVKADIVYDLVNQQFSVNGEQKEIANVFPSTSTYAPYLFYGRNSSTTSSQSTNFYYTAGKIYLCKVYGNDGELRLDLVPAVRNSDGLVGMFDVVNKGFYANMSKVSTGSFKAGPAV